MREKRAWRHLPQWQREGMRDFNPAEWHQIPKSQNTGVGYLTLEARQYLRWLHSQDLLRCPQMRLFFPIRKRRKLNEIFAHRN